MQHLTLRPSQSAQVHLVFTPPPLKDWKDYPVTTFNGSFIVTFPSAPSGTPPQSWVLKALCSRPIVSLRTAGVSLPYERPTADDTSVYRHPPGADSKLISFGRVHVAARIAVRRAMLLKNCSAVPAVWSVLHLPKDAEAPVSPSRCPSLRTASRKTRSETASLFLVSKKDCSPLDQFEGNTARGPKLMSGKDGSTSSLAPSCCFSYPSGAPFAAPHGYHISGTFADPLGEPVE